MNRMKAFYAMAVLGLIGASGTANAMLENSGSAKPFRLARKPLLSLHRHFSVRSDAGGKYDLSKVDWSRLPEGSEGRAIEFRRFTDEADRASPDRLAARLDEAALPMMSERARQLDELFEHDSASFGGVIQVLNERANAHVRAAYADSRSYYTADQVRRLFESDLGTPVIRAIEQVAQPANSQPELRELPSEKRFKYRAREPRPIYEMPRLAARPKLELTFGQRTFLQLVFKAKHERTDAGRDPQTFVDMLVNGGVQKRVREALNDRVETRDFADQAAAQAGTDADTMAFAALAELQRTGAHNPPLEPAVFGEMVERTQDNPHFRVVGTPASYDIVSR
jgi:hypothetical protein